MNKKIIFVFLSFMTLFTFNSCQNNANSEDTYTVWTDLGTYSEFQSSFGTTLNDGMYVRLELTSTQ